MRFRRRALVLAFLAALTALALFLRNTPGELLTGAYEASPEVLRALARGRPVLALESTVLTHGLPYPENLRLQRELEALARAHGAVPATIAVLGGRVTAGLSAAQVEALARPGAAVKASARDLPAARLFGATAGTTVAATARVAGALGIRVFATGGIGGVHRQPAGGLLLDVSADVAELARTSVLVVSAGCKQVLDLRNTAEALETAQVLAVGYRTHEMPAFYARASGVRLEHAVETPREAARLLALARPRGYLLFNPIPPEDEVDLSAEIERVVAAEAAAGKDATPALLAALARESGGRSVRANLALLRGNARLGAEVAVEAARLAHGRALLRNPAFYALCGAGLGPRAALAVTAGLAAVLGLLALRGRL